MVKPKSGPFSRVGGDDQLIDKVNWVKTVENPAALAAFLNELALIS